MSRVKTRFLVENGFFNVVAHPAGGQCSSRQRREQRLDSIGRNAVQLEQVSLGKRRQIHPVCPVRKLQAAAQPCGMHRRDTQPAASLVEKVDKRPHDIICEPYNSQSKIRVEIFH